jgi:hypothetical protein
MVIQSIGFNIHQWSLAEAKQWAREHKFKPIKIALEENYLKLRLFDPKKFRRFSTKDIGNGIHLIIGYY